MEERSRVVPLWLFAVVMVVAALCAVGWWRATQPSVTVWGTVGEVAGGFAAATALVFASLEIRQSSRQRAEEERRRILAEDERREAMARSVDLSALLVEADGTWHCSASSSTAATTP